MLMPSTHYLPSERVNYSNYPELRRFRTDINNIMSYMVTVDDALRNYNNGIKDKIDLNTNELETYITLCRNVTESLGNYSKVCFDVLLILRKIQTDLQNVRFLSREYGDKYVGRPTSTEEDIV